MRLQRCSLGLKRMKGNGTYWDADLHSFVMKRWEWTGHRIQVKKLHASFKGTVRISLVAQLLGLHASSAGGHRFHPQLGKILHVTCGTNHHAPLKKRKKQKQVTIPFVSWGTLPSIAENTEDTNGSGQNQAFQSREPFVLAAFWPLSACLPWGCWGNPLIPAPHGWLGVNSAMSTSSEAQAQAISTWIWANRGLSRAAGTRHPGLFSVLPLLINGFLGSACACIMASLLAR